MPEAESQGVVSQGRSLTAATMFSAVTDQPNGSESPGKLRARASRARKHARSLADDPAAKRLEQLAEELDAQARQIERDDDKPQPDPPED